MKNGIKSNSQKSFLDIVQAIIQLDDLQNIYFRVLEKIERLLEKIGSSEENTINFSELYSANKPQELLQTIMEQLGKQKKQQTKEEIKSLRLLKLYLNKSRVLQSKISFLIHNFSDLIVKLKSKKECQILITSLSLIMKKRQKFQLKEINKNNQLLKNLESLSQNNSNLQNLKYKTIKQIIEQKPILPQENDSSGHTIKIKEEQDMYQKYYQQSIYNQYFNYQLYQQYCYYQYQLYPYMYNYYYHPQISQ